MADEVVPIDSILNSIKKMLGIEHSDETFDDDVKININSVLLGLNQIGVGDENGFFIKDSNDTWSDFIGERKDIESVKTYVYLKVKLIFDPPPSSFVLDAMERQIREFEWRINVQTDKEVII